MNADEPIKDNPIDELGGRESEVAGKGASAACHGKENKGHRPSLSGEIGRANWQEFHLRRLERFISLEAELNNPGAAVDQDFDWKLRLVRRAIYCCFCDCIALDIRDEARELLKETVKRA